ERWRAGPTRLGHLSALVAPSFLPSDGAAPGAPRGRGRPAQTAGDAPHDPHGQATDILWDSFEDLTDEALRPDAAAAGSPDEQTIWAAD
ncbi:unnamed protein product, partial [Prorocentrum cordatum]